MSFNENVYSIKLNFRDNGFCENSQLLDASVKYNMLSCFKREN